MLIEVIIYIILLATALPVGAYLAKLCDDELVKDRRYFRLMSYTFLILALIFLIFYDNSSIILSLIYMVLLFEVMIYQSRKIKDKKNKR